MKRTARAQTASEDTPVTVAYFYKAKWGYHDEFIELFRKNHYPVLQAQIESGRLLRVETYTPRFHGDGRNDWTFMTILVYRNWQVFGKRGEDKPIIKRMFPDQVAYKKEEQRRFELLEAHWDVPLSPTPMG